MKNFLILTGILTVIFMAVIDTKARIEEVDNIAATTPAQVEMKPDLDKTGGQGIMNKYDKIQPPKAPKAPSLNSQPLQTQQDTRTPHPTKSFPIPDTQPKP